MTGDHMNTLARLNLPNPNCFIEGTRDNVIRLRIEIDTENDVGVATEGFNAVTAGGGASIPDAESAVIGSRTDVVRVRGPSEVGDAIGVTGETVEEREGGGGPDD